MTMGFAKRMAMGVFDAVSQAGGQIAAQMLQPEAQQSYRRPISAEEDQNFRMIFQKLAGEDMEISAAELQTILNKVISNHEDLKTDGFSLESTRSMVALMDSDGTGKLGFDEFKILWNKIKEWQNVFKSHDADCTGTMSCEELSEAICSAGFQLNDPLYNAIALRYADESNSIDFDNFICCLVRLEAMFRAFKAYNRDGDDTISLNIMEWLELSMYA
uniref:Calpain, small subunit 1 b n=1 Tax=Eptatretus burgeri TaxID=7764 RepID=A0A8C4QL00_EPTBU